MEPINFLGVTYWIINAGYLTTAPTLKELPFTNARENDAIVDHLVSEKILTTDASYLYRASGIKAKVDLAITRKLKTQQISPFSLQTESEETILPLFKKFYQELIPSHFGSRVWLRSFKVTDTITLKAAS